MMEFMPRMRKFVIGFIGGALLIVGLISILIPTTPAFILIPLAVALLATEFYFVRKWVKDVHRKVHRKHMRNKGNVVYKKTDRLLEKTQGKIEDKAKDRESKRRSLKRL